MYTEPVQGYLEGTVPAFMPACPLTSQWEGFGDLL